MSKALVPRKKSVLSGLIPAGASALVPGLGQFFNGEGDKALGVFVVAAGAGLATQLPLIGGIAAIVGGATWLYGVGDAYFRGRKK
jgi:TM2 domain-containing membrane protein YozV